MFDSMAHWAQIATSEIPYKPDRDKVFQELFDHMADGKDYYVEHGLSQPDASAKAVAQMGDAWEAAGELGKLYRSFWYYVAKVTKVIAICYAVIVFFLVICFIADWSESRYQPDPLSCPYPVVSEVSPNQTIQIGGYAITATNVLTYDLEDRLGVDISLDISFHDPYLKRPEFLSHLALVDDLGNRYNHINDFPDENWPSYCLHTDYYATDSFSASCWINCEGIPLGRRLVAVAYDRDGVTWILPLEVSP